MPKIGFFVGNRSPERFEKLCENISHINAKFYTTDNFSAYNIIPEDKHLNRKSHFSNAYFSVLQKTHR